MFKLLIATKNKGKFGEMSEVLEGIDLVSLADVGCEEDCEESEDSFEGNALQKARFFAELTGLPTLADDSGIIVDALAGELGVKTRRWGAGASASDDEWIDYFLERMEGVENRGARFVAAIAFVDLGGGRGGEVEKFFLGETCGVITDELEAPIVEGIPLSSCFRPEGVEKVFANLSVAEKNLHSHRGKAMMKAKEFLKDFVL